METIPFDKNRFSFEIPSKNSVISDNSFLTIVVHVHYLIFLAYLTNGNYVYLVTFKLIGLMHFALVSVSYNSQIISSSFYFLVVSNSQLE